MNYNVFSYIFVIFSIYNYLCEILLIINIHLKIVKNFDHIKATQALNYFAKLNGGEINKMKAIKLIWLSDRLHLRKYARTITKDNYLAMKNGSVASNTLDIANNKYYDFNYYEGYIKKINKLEIKSIGELDLDVFSDSEEEIIKIVWNFAKDFDQFKLSEFSHLFPEWKKHKNKVENGGREEIDINDFFENIEDESGLFNETKKDINVIKDMYKIYC